jgi:hypothetical protein
MVDTRAGTGSNRLNAAVENLYRKLVGDVKTKHNLLMAKL